MLGGALLLGIAILQWSQIDFGDLSYSDGLRLMIPSVVLLVTGTQVVFSSFFLSILGLETR
jgi:hypothetical protein